MAVVTSPVEQLAQRLRALRDRAGITQGDLAKIFTADGRPVSAAAISSWERRRNPVLVPQSRLEPYSRLAAMVGDPPWLPARDQLSSQQKADCADVLAELTHLLGRVRDRSATIEVPAVRTGGALTFDDEGPVVIIAPDSPAEARGPLADNTNPNYTAMRLFADQDALIDLYGHIRGENDAGLPVFYKRASMVNTDDLTGHLILIGGIAYNAVTELLFRQLERLPIRQVAVPELTTGEIFAVGHGATEQRFLPMWSRADGGVSPQLEQDVGLLARMPNPFNSSKTLTLCNGIHSPGVVGAVRALTDTRFREVNEAYLAERFPGGEYGLLLRVPVFHGEALSPDLLSPGTILFEWPHSSGRKPRSEGT